MKENGFIANLNQRLAARRRRIRRQTEYLRLKRIRKYSIPKYTHCKNCGTELKGMYCHNCGQYALDTEQPFWKYVKQYFENVYQFDSKVWQTMYNLFAHPGLLTNEFNAGKINSYVHPFRLYMFISVIFFTLFFWGISHEATNVFDNLVAYNMKPELIERINSSDLEQDTTVILSEPFKFVKAMEKAGLKNDRKLFDIYKIDRRLAVVTMPSLIADSCLYSRKMNDKEMARYSDYANPWNEYKESVMYFASEKDELPADNIANVFNSTDSMISSVQSAMNELVNGERNISDWINKKEYFDQKDEIKSMVENIIATTSKYMPIFMMFLIPVFALLTKWKFRKANKNYMSHFVCALHINTVFLTLLPIPILAIDFIENEILIKIIVSLFALYIGLYTFFSFRNVFKIKFWPTLRKTISVSLLFSLLSFILAVSLILYMLVDMVEKL